MNALYYPAEPDVIYASLASSMKADWVKSKYYSTLRFLPVVYVLRYKRSADAY